MGINYFIEEIDFNPDNWPGIQKWIIDVIKEKGYSAGTINYIFCADDYLLKINQQYLNHDSYTDIITFDYVSDNVVSGDIFISIERVQENALNYNITFEKELNRVIIHGILHLTGEKDKTEAEKKYMRSQEDKYLSQIPN